MPTTLILSGMDGGTRSGPRSSGQGEQVSQAFRSLARNGSITRVVGPVVLVGALLVLAACGTGKVHMTDAELDEVYAGKYTCGLFGTSGPCAGSFLQVFDPSLPPNPACGTLPGANTNCVTSFSSSPLPPGGSVLLEQSFVGKGPLTYQDVHQRNSLSAPGPQPPLECVSCQLFMDFNLNRIPGRW